MRLIIHTVSLDCSFKNTVLVQRRPRLFLSVAALAELHTEQQLPVQQDNLQNKQQNSIKQGKTYSFQV